MTLKGCWIVARRESWYASSNKCLFLARELLEFILIPRIESKVSFKKKKIPFHQYIYQRFRFDGYRMITKGLSKRKREREGKNSHKNWIFLEIVEKFFQHLRIRTDTCGNRSWSFPRKGRKCITIEGKSCHFPSKEDPPFNSRHGFLIEERKQIARKILRLHRGYQFPPRHHVHPGFISTIWPPFSIFYSRLPFNRR